MIILESITFISAIDISCGDDVATRSEHRLIGLMVRTERGALYTGIPEWAFNQSILSQNLLQSGTCVGQGNLIDVELDGNRGLKSGAKRAGFSRESNEGCHFMLAYSDGSGEHVEVRLRLGNPLLRPLYTKDSHCVRRRDQTHINNRYFYRSV